MVASNKSEKKGRKMNESYVFYKSFHEACKGLSDEEYGKIMRIINEYSFNGIEPVFSESEKIEKMAFNLIKPQIDANFKRREVGKLGGRKKKNDISEIKKEAEKEENSLFENEEKQTESLNLEEKKKPEEKKKKFVKPSIQEIQNYISENHYSFSAEKFFNYYESKGWLIGKSPMKDWKAACRTWNGNNFSPQKAQISRDTENIDEFLSFFQQKG